MLWSALKNPNEILWKSLSLGMAEMLRDIMKLSVAERILLVEAIWDSIPKEGEKGELSDETKRLLDQRLAAHADNPESGSSWEEVKGRIQTK